MDYPLCEQTVTVYRQENGQITRRVAEGCFYRWEDRCSQDSQGLRFDRKFLLIQPGEKAIYPGDRIYPGVGPEVTEGDWAAFTPLNVPGLGVVTYATAYRLHNQVTHYQAGNK